MTQIAAKILADSTNEFGNRITTMIVTMPRYILSEFNTHRMFSRNSASSRAIPFNKLVESIKKNPFVPLAWMKDHKGMQGTEYFDSGLKVNIWDNQLTDYEPVSAPEAWWDAMYKAVDIAEQFNKAGVTKQIVNRILEPYMWHTVIVTATEWENFFALRCPQYTFNGMEFTGTFRSRKSAIGAIDENGKEWLTEKHDAFWLEVNKGQADIHMMATAEAMWDAMNESKPIVLKAGEWHIPFHSSIVLNIAEVARLYNESGGVGLPTDEFIQKLQIKVATASCARVSYTIVGEETKIASCVKDVELHDRLATSGHWSPFEHCAKAMSAGEFDASFHKGFEGDGPDFYTNGWSGNFRGFTQYRKTFSNENIRNEI